MRCGCGSLVTTLSLQSFPYPWILVLGEFFVIDQNAGGRLADLTMEQQYHRQNTRVSLEFLVGGSFACSNLFWKCICIEGRHDTTDPLMAPRLRHHADDGSRGGTRHVSAPHRRAHRFLVFFKCLPVSSPYCYAETKAAHNQYGS